MKTKKDFISVSDMTETELFAVLESAKRLKEELKKIGKNKPIFVGKTLVMIFEKPSLRTHASFEIGMTQLGGHALYFGPEHIGLGKRESIEHAARVLSSMGDILMARVFNHKTVVELAKYSSVPVINGLSNLEHPCQILADIMTMQEVKRRLKGLKVAYVGDGENNIPHSLALASGLLGMRFVCASPKGYMIKPEIVNQAGIIKETHNPEEAVKDADVVYTDTWISMGDETDKTKRMKVFRPYQVNIKLMKLAKPNAIFMHDMPVYLGNEVTKEVFDGPQSVVYQQAENRLHAQKALMMYLLEK